MNQNQKSSPVLPPNCWAPWGKTLYWAPIQSPLPFLYGIPYAIWRCNHTDTLSTNKPKLFVPKPEHVSYLKIKKSVSNWNWTLYRWSLTHELSTYICSINKWTLSALTSSLLQFKAAEYGSNSGAFPVILEWNCSKLIAPGMKLLRERKWLEALLYLWTKRRMGHVSRRAGEGPGKRL